MMRDSVVLDRCGSVSSLLCVLLAGRRGRRAFDALTSFNT